MHVIIYYYVKLARCSAHNILEQPCQAIQAATYALREVGAGRMLRVRPPAGDLPDSKAAGSLHQRPGQAQCLNPPKGKAHMEEVRRMGRRHEGALQLSQGERGPAGAVQGHHTTARGGQQRRKSRRRGRQQLTPFRTDHRRCSRRGHQASLLVGVKSQTQQDQGRLREAKEEGPADHHEMHTVQGTG